MMYKFEAYTQLEVVPGVALIVSLTEHFTLHLHA